MTIYLVDEDKIQLEPFKVELEFRGYSVEFIKDADEAFLKLSRIGADDVDLVIIDVMLAANINKESSKFNRHETNDFLETGLRLIEKLQKANPTIFPKKAILFSNATDSDLVNAIEKAASTFFIPYLDKRRFQSPLEFGDKIEEILGKI